MIRLTFLARTLLPVFTLLFAKLLVLATEAPPSFSLRTHPSDLKLALDSSWNERLRPYIEARAMGFIAWTSKGMLVLKWQGKSWQLFEVSGPRKKLRPVSNFTERVDRFFANPVPSQKWILLNRDKNGDEEYHLSLYQWDQQKETPWPMPPGRSTNLIWNNSGTEFAYTHSLPGKKDGGIRLGTLPDKDKPILLRAGSWSPLDFSPDGKSILVLRELSSTESQLWKLNLSDTVPAQLLSNEPSQWFESAFFLDSNSTSPTLAFLSNRGGEFQRIYQFCPGVSAPQPLSPLVVGDVEWMTPDRIRKTILYSVNLGGSSQLYKLDLQSNQIQTLASLPKGISHPCGFHPKTHVFALGASTMENPGEVFTLDTKGKIQSWDLNSTRFPKKPMVVREIQFPTFDSLQNSPRLLSAWLTSPSSRKGPFPVLISIHGGPELQARPDYNAFLRFCVQELGFAVLQPNVRGSTGFGKSFQSLDDGFHRVDAVRDLGALLDWITLQPELDSSRIAVQGRSYGGFMTLAAMSRYNSRIKAGLSGVGISHFPTFLEGTADYRRDLRRSEYGDERIPTMRKFLDSISPLSHTAQFRAPLFLTHGRNDPRVPYLQSESIFNALEKYGNENWFLTLEGEGHGLKQIDEELRNSSIAIQFLLKHLKIRK